MIGLASGSWAQVLAHEPDLEHLTIVEINPGYEQLIAHHPEVRGVLTNPKVTIDIDDGRRWLQRNPARRFDVIVMNTTWHWRAHMTNLLSAEFMRLARSHLLGGGLFYFNTTSSADVQKTAMTEFPYGLRMINFVAVSDSPIHFDKDRFRELLTTYRIEGVPAIDSSTDEGKSMIESIAGIADTLDRPPQDDGLERRESILERTKSAGIVTDDNMLVELRDPGKMFETP
jgi:spermidine synthase